MKKKKEARGRGCWMKYYFTVQCHRKINKKEINCSQETGKHKSGHEKKSINKNF